jgi:23S rRNA (cytosine1962-C5)-methyltransferase
MNELITVELPHILDGEDKGSPFKNRIRNTYRHIRKWAKRTSTNCFRIYDRDIPNYHFAVDYYAGRFLIHYFPRSQENPDPPAELEKEVVDALKSIFNADEEMIYWRTRIRREKTQQYEKTGDSKQFFTAVEYGVQFKINLLDYLDTGLFLDHRETRRYVASIAKGKRLLNLFAYTCSFSVHAAVGGSIWTKSVDLSNTYTEWGEDNFRLNALSLKSNPIVRADCMKFLESEIYSGEKYDIIVIDPPTISRSKKMDGMFDVQRDYIFLIRHALRLLRPDGVIFFSTNSRKFSFDQSQFEGCSIIDISRKTIPIDFHDQKIHRTWKITAQSENRSFIKKQSI